MKLPIFFILMSVVTLMEAACKCQTPAPAPKPSPTQTCHIGLSGFFSDTTPYGVSTVAYPNFTNLSKKRNSGSTEGKVKLTPSGLKINEAGNYTFSFSTIVLNTTNDPTQIPVFIAAIAVNDEVTIQPFFISEEELNFNFFTTIQLTGILKNVAAGSTLSLKVANDGHGVEPKVLNIFSWQISVSKIPCT